MLWKAVPSAGARLTQLGVPPGTAGPRSAGGQQDGGVEKRIALGMSWMWVWIPALLLVNLVT